ncbi:CD209 antigen-like protein E [Amphibalanus amphitrite]|uniref:CD209 antigen-like protein E n=1 Tax=Amphibalanus amphitrite TaxID=1232801 RepID=A0A6A4X7A1_AMPAM|nr:CD209 antigen-like protein E [Amphibalanus amphitrite]
MQPLDRTVFKALKAGYNIAVENYMRTSGGKITMFDMGQLIGKAFNRVATPDKAIKGFEVTDDGTCRLFSGDCRGPAVNSSQQTTDHYMARNTCPGRCLRRLGQTSGFTKSADRCAALGAHLAVPRSDDENQCAMDVAVAAGKSVWLGLTDVVTEGQFVGADGCGVVSASGPQWGIGQPNDYQGQDYVGGHPMGWNDFRETEPCYPLCQLQFCYQPGCV